MIVIFAFSHQPYSGRETEKYLGGANVPVRKLGHITEFMVLFLLVRWALQRQGEPKNDSSGESAVLRFVKSPSVLAFVFAISYAATDEWHQSFVPGRSSNWNDVAVDACGVSAGAVALAIAGKARKKRRGETDSTV
jgi:VanZ family protein